MRSEHTLSGLSLSGEPKGHTQLSGYLYTFANPGRFVALGLLQPSARKTAACAGAIKLFVIAKMCHRAVSGTPQVRLVRDGARLFFCERRFEGIGATGGGTTVRADGPSLGHRLIFLRCAGNGG